MGIGLIEIGLEQLLARKSCNYADPIDKITCAIVNIEHKSNTKIQKRIKTWYKIQMEILTKLLVYEHYGRPNLLVKQVFSCCKKLRLENHFSK